MTVTLISQKPPRRRAPFIKGICAAAAVLDVDRAHLWRVLTGRVRSQGVLERYDALIRRQASELSKSEPAPRPSGDPKTQS
jgi:hypothetical protein